MWGDKNINQIKENDIVKTYNEDTGKTETSRVNRVMKRKTYEIISIKLDNEIIKTTEEHPFYVKEKGYTEASKLQKGDKVLKQNNTYATVNDITHTNYKDGIYVYNFEVDNNHNYYVGKGSYLVHNRCTYDNMDLK